MPRVSAAARAIFALVLLLSTSTAGWAAACARAPETPSPHAMHAGMHHGGHGAMHHSAPPAPENRPTRNDGPECPLLAMTGGSCIGAAHLPSIVSAPTALVGADDGYPPAAAVRDRLLAASLFHPPKA
ncbi:MAG TPA: hypothetical protein VF092_18455 [Longimicrobium sp.]